MVVAGDDDGGLMVVARMTVPTVPPTHYIFIIFLNFSFLLQFFLFWFVLFILF